MVGVSASNKVAASVGKSGRVEEMEVQQQQTPPPSDLMGMKAEPLSPSGTSETGMSAGGGGGSTPRKAGGPGRPLTADRKRPYPCNLCPSRFGSKMELEEHQNSHTGQKPFECDVCKARFNRRSTLWNHKRIHSDAKPFVCPVCEMTFKWKNSLKCHKEMHLRKNESGGLDLEQLRQLTYASAAKRKAGEGVPTSSSSKKRKHTSQGQQQALQSPNKVEANGHHMEQEQKHQQQLPAMHLQSVPVMSSNNHGSSLLQQALQSAQIPDNNPQPNPHHSSGVSSHPVNSINSEPPPDPAPAQHHYVTSHHLTLPIMSAESKTDSMVSSFSHSQTTAVLHSPHLPPQFVNVRLVNPMPVVEQLMGSLTPPTAPQNPGNQQHQHAHIQQHHQQQHYSSPAHATTVSGAGGHLLRSPNPPQPVSYHQHQQQLLEHPLPTAAADYVPNFDYLLPSQVNNSYQQQESQPVSMNSMNTAGMTTAVATAAASPGYLVKIVPYDQW